MSTRYQAGIIRPGYNALKVPNAPTIGTATASGANCVSVTLTAPSDVGGGAISSFTAFTSCGAYSGSNTLSPVTVTGLTTGTSYTFKVIATNLYGPSLPSGLSNSATPALPVGQEAYTTAGSYSWVAPAGVTSVSVVAVGGGGSGALRFLCGGQYQICGAGGAGGGLGYKNNYTVIPGNSYSLQVGGVATDSYFVSTGVVKGGGGGNAGAGYTAGTGGTYTGDGGGNGGNGCTDGAGGAGGYAGNGGRGGGNGNGLSGSGGGAGGGGGGGGYSGAGGGGVGLLGQGSNGTGGGGGVAPFNTGGGAGSGGTAGSNSSGSTNAPGSNGGAYGGGGGGASASYTGSTLGLGAAGAVRIIWPGSTRSFPSTDTGNL